jgi:hypothetical protein
MFKVILPFGSCFRCQFRSFSLFHRVLGTTELLELFSPFPYANDLEFHKLFWYNSGYSCCLPRKHSLYLGIYIIYVCHWWVVHCNIINVISDHLSIFKEYKAETRRRYHALSYFINCVTVCDSIKQFGLKKRNVIFTQRSNTTASLSAGSFIVKRGTQSIGLKYINICWKSWMTRHYEIVLCCLLKENTQDSFAISKLHGH